MQRGHTFPRRGRTLIGFVLVRLLDGFETTADAVQGRLPALMQEAGFRHVVEVAAVATLLGTMKVWWARID